MLLDIAYKLDYRLVKVMVAYTPLVIVLRGITKFLEISALAKLLFVVRIVVLGKHGVLYLIVVTTIVIPRL